MFFCFLFFLGLGGGKPFSHVLPQEPVKGCRDGDAEHHPRDPEDAAAHRAPRITASVHWPTTYRRKQSLSTDRT